MCIRDSLSSVLKLTCIKNGAKCEVWLLTALNEDSLCVGVARVGCDSQCLQVSTLSEMKALDLGPPLHSLVIVGQLHPLEADMLTQFANVTTNNALTKLRTADAI